MSSCGTLCSIYYEHFKMTILKHYRDREKSKFSSKNSVEPSECMVRVGAVTWLNHPSYVYFLIKYNFKMSQNMFFMTNGFHENLYFKFILNFDLFLWLKFRALFSYARVKGSALESALGSLGRNINSLYWVTVFKIESFTSNANSKSSYRQILSYQRQQPWVPFKKLNDIV